MEIVLHYEEDIKVGSHNQHQLNKKTSVSNIQE